MMTPSEIDASNRRRLRISIVSRLAAYVCVGLFLPLVAGAVALALIDLGLAAGCVLVSYVTVTPERKAGAIAGGFGPPAIEACAEGAGWPSAGLRRAAAVVAVTSYSILFGWIPLLVIAGLGHATGNQNLWTPVILVAAGVCLFAFARLGLPSAIERWPDRWAESDDAKGFDERTRMFRARVLNTYAAVLVALGVLYATIVSS